MKTFPLLNEDRIEIHNWTLDEEECPISKYSPYKESHKHFMKCGDCGVKRYGAYASPGSYHYFYYEHPNQILSTHEVIPPCLKTGSMPEIAIKQVFICNKCYHIIHDFAINCDCSYLDKEVLIINGCFYLNGK